MPFLPTLNDLKAVTISINPLNLFNDSPRSPDTPTGRRHDEHDEGQPGPGPSSLSNRRNVQAFDADGRPLRPTLKTSTSSSDSLDSQDGRKSSGQSVVIMEDDDRPRKSKMKKIPVESYVIVKPPPTTSKNPLNLQIQLVVNNKGRNRSASDVAGNTTRSPSMYSVTETSLSRDGQDTPNSVDLTNSSEAVGGVSDSPTSTGIGEDTPTQPLRRVTSRKSSASTVASTATNASSAKRIQPMFNLKFHAVTNATTVTDAKTDDKVAKFAKRAIEVLDVGILEPSEIWTTPGNASALFPSVLEEQSRPSSTYSLTPISPMVSRIEDPSWLRTSLEGKVRPEIPEGGAKKLFGKIGGAFKKKTQKDVPASPAMGPSPTPSIGTFPPSASMIRGQSKDSEIGHMLGQPTFGCSPMVIARRTSNATPLELAPPIEVTPEFRSFGTRPVKYIWTVRKWDRKVTDGWGAHLVAAAANGVVMKGSVFEGEDMVSFEWVKMKGSPTSGCRSRRSSNATAPRSRSNLAPNDSPTENRASPNLLPTPLPALERPGPIRRASASAASTRTAGTSASASPNRAGTPTLACPDDSSQVYHTGEEDESDPEDSETPWQCFFVIRHTGLRIPVGTITPAPHHPKVVAQMKLPQQFDSPCLAQLEGEEETRRKTEKEVCLKEEAVKDVVCVTALWLVAREGWGGLRKKRKGP